MYGLLRATLSTFISSGIDVPLLVSYFISTFTSSGIFDCFSVLISSFGSSFFYAFDTDFPPFTGAVVLGYGFAGGCFFAGAGDGDGMVGFLSFAAI